MQTVNLWAVAVIKALNSDPRASKVSSDDVGGPESVFCLAGEARVKLTANLWVQAGPVNGAVRIFVAIHYVLVSGIS